MGDASRIRRSAQGDWVDNSAVETGFEVERKTGTGSFQSIATLAANVVTFAPTRAGAVLTKSLVLRNVGPGLLAGTVGTLRTRSP